MESILFVIGVLVPLILMFIKVALDLMNEDIILPISSNGFDYVFSLWINMLICMLYVSVFQKINPFIILGIEILVVAINIIYVEKFDKWALNAKKDFWEEIIKESCVHNDTLTQVTEEEMAKFHKLSRNEQKKWLQELYIYEPIKEENGIFIKSASGLKLISDVNFSLLIETDEDFKLRCSCSARSHIITIIISVIRMFQIDLCHCTSPCRIIDSGTNDHALSL